MLSVAALYGLHPIDLQSTAAVARLHAELLARLAAAHPDWDFLAVSPEAKPLPGVGTRGVGLPASARVKLRARQTSLGRRLYRPRAAKGQRFDKALWAEAASAVLAESLPDRASTVVICAHAETVLAVRRALPRARVVQWINTPALSEPAALAADAAVVPSLAVYRESWHGLGNQYPTPIWVIPPGIDATVFRPPSVDERQEAREALGLTRNDMAVAFVSRHWIKGGKVIERALASLPAMRERVVLLSAGEPRREHRLLGASSEVWKLGLISPPELRRMYGAADIGVVPSVTEEAFGLAGLEMMATGLPVVASRVGGIPEVMEDGASGRLVEVPNAVDAWVDALTELLRDAEARVKLGAAARSSVLRRFTPELAVEEWSRLLTQLGTGP